MDTGSGRASTRWRARPFHRNFEYPLDARLVAVAEIDCRRMVKKKKAMFGKFFFFFFLSFIFFWADASCLWCGPFFSPETKPNPFNICNKSPRLTNRRQSTVLTLNANPPRLHLLVAAVQSTKAEGKQCSSSCRLAVDGRMATTTNHCR